MYKENEMNYIKAMTGIHAGAGEGLETVDMPIQREKHTNIPKIEGSSLKGSIKHMIYHTIDGDKNLLYELLGPENDNENYASKIGFTDAKLLLFPIKSTTDIFKLITCPYVLSRWCEDINFCKNEDSNTILQKDLKNYPNLEDAKCIVLEKHDEKKVVLEEYVFDIDQNDESRETFNQEIQKELENLGVEIKRVVIVSDSVFIDLVSMYTEIITRNKIDIKTGTAKDGALFTEEYLPEESILYFITLATPSFLGENNEEKNTLIQLNHWMKGIFQVGGNATIGKGFVQILNFTKEEQS